MQKVVLKLSDLQDEKAKQKAMKMVSSLTGIDSIAMDMNEKKLTVVGDMDPVKVAHKLKRWHTEILSVGPAKEPEKKKDEAKKENDKKQKDPNEEIAELIKLLRSYNPHITPPYYVYTVEENPNACLLC